MTTSEILQSALYDGVNDPSPISRLIAFDWYDGPISGALQMGDGGPVYRFELLDESQRSEGTEERVYGLYPLPSDSLARLIDLIAPHIAPRWPVWVPIWRFPSEDIQQAVEEEMEQIMSLAGSLTWVIVGAVGRGAVRAVPVRVSRAS